MRVRVIQGGMTGLSFARRVLNPINYPVVSFQLISHKVMRWSVPVFALFALLTNILEFFIYTSDIGVLLLLAQLSFYSFVVLGFLKEKLELNIPVVGIFHYLFLVNLASLVAIYKFLTAELEATWEPERKEQMI